jgi:DNA-binding NarL/FixJ family response regulator
MSYAQDCMKSVEYLFNKYCKDLENPVYLGKKTKRIEIDKKSRGSANPITEEEKAKVKDLWSKGYKMSSIAKELKRSTGSISNICTELKQHELLKRGQ